MSEETQEEHDARMRVIQAKLALIPMNWPVCLEDLNEIYDDKDYEP